MTEVKKDILWRLYLTFTLLIILGIAIVVQIVKVQYVQGDEYRAMADDAQLDYKVIPAKRGNIYAQGGDLLAASFPYYIISMDPTVVAPDLFRSGIDSLSRGLSEVLGEHPASWYKEKIVTARNNKRQYLILDKKVSVPQLIRLRELPIFREGRYRGGFMYTKTERRERPYGSLASRTVGYAREGTNVGIEGAFDAQLAGTPGRQLMRKVSGGVWMPVSDETEVEPHDGLDIITTIDVNIQDITENALRRTLEKNDADWGTAVVMEVKTGKVRAISNLTRQSSGNYEEVLNYAVAERVEPGSTFKLFSLLALLEDNYVSINDSVDLNQGQIQYYKRTMWDSEGAHHYNNVTIKTAFAKSSNVGISRLANQFYAKSPERYLQHLSATGIDKPTGIAIQGEPEPIFKRDPAARDWYGTTLPWMSVGYELQITPLQMLNFYNAIANGGKLMQPMLVDGTSQYGRIIDKYDPVVLKESICSEKTLMQLQQSMVAVVDSGTARNLRNEHYGIAGKTGTAQKLVNGTYASGQYLASFIGYFPAEAPRYSIMVMVSNPTNGIYYGGSVAGPVFREIADKVYSHHLQIIEPVNSSDSLLLGLDLRSKGYGSDYREIFDWFNIDIPDNVAGEWWYVDLQQSKADVDDIVIHEQTMPSVKGMGARDAIYLLESQGLKVQVSGVGKVVYQSVAPGAATYKGAQVQIRLG